MSDKDINQMDFKELRNEVQLLRDELAVMRRKYEDLFYNLDTENFSSKLTKKINSVVTSDEVESRITQEADKINLRVNGVEGSLSSSIQLTAQKIDMVVSNEGDGTESIFKQTADGFLLDGHKVTITGILYFTDDDGDNDFWIVHDQSQDPNFKQVMLSTATNDNGKHTPIVIGDVDDDKEINVYIGGYADGNQPATRQWVLEQLGK